jgi:hypothetical protein
MGRKCICSRGSVVGDGGKGKRETEIKEDVEGRKRKVKPN